jgi:hypothetical protein
MLDLETIKRRIRALQNMTTERGASEAEALNAATAMADLLRDHGLTAEAITAERPSEAATVGQEAYGQGKRLHDVARCASRIAAFFDCKVWVNTSLGVKSIVFFGFPQDTAAAAAMMSLVRNAMEYEWAAYWRQAKDTSHVSGRSARTSFLAGMASRINERLRVMKEQSRQEAQRIASAHQSTALVIVKDQAVAVAFQGLGIRLGRGAARSNGYDGGARAAGRAAGDRVNLTGSRGQICAK